VHPVDLEREQDIEHLRRVALAQHAQIEQLIAALARKCKELEVFKGSHDELQQTLALIETLTKQQSALLADPNKNPAPSSDDGSSNKDGKKRRDKIGPTDQTKLRMVKTPCVGASIGRSLPRASGVPSSSHAEPRLLQAGQHPRDHKSNAASVSVRALFDGALVAVFDGSHSRSRALLLLVGGRRPSTLVTRPPS
jgi:hypothetical protein